MIETTPLLNLYTFAGSTAALFAGVVWFLTYVPAFLLSIDIAMSIPVQIITCLSINTAMSYGFQLILARESTGGKDCDTFSYKYID